MRVAHLLPRQRGNVAVDNYRFVNALLWMCRTGPRGGTCRSATASGSPSAGGSPLVRERRDGTPVHGIAGGADHRRRGLGARHGLHEREGPPARHGRPEKRGPQSVGVSRGGRNAKVRVASDSGSTLVEIHPGPGNEHDAAHERAAHGSARRVDALILPVTAVAGRLASGQVSRRDGDSFATVNVKLGHRTAR